jgi:hypothetical protein
MALPLFLVAVAFEVSRRGPKAQKSALQPDGAACFSAPLREKSRLAVKTWTKVHFSGSDGPFSIGDLADLFLTFWGVFGPARPFLARRDAIHPPELAAKREKRGERLNVSAMAHQAGQFRPYLPLET